MPGWTDRPKVLDHWLRYWTSWHTWADWREFTPSSAIAWIDSQFAHEPTHTRMVLVQVWLALARQWVDSEPRPASGGGTDDEPVLE